MAAALLGGSVTADTIAQDTTRSSRPDSLRPDTTLSTTGATTSRDTVVYVTRTGKKYHREGCRYLSGGASSISLKEARRDYTPCSRCDPPK
jgi:hypothetical protein